MDAFQLRYECLLLARGELSGRGAYEIDDLFSLAYRFSDFIGGKGARHRDELKASTSPVATANVIKAAPGGDDPATFISAEFHTISPTRGPIPLQLYDFQRKVVSEIHNPNKNFCCINSARQMGLTTIMTAYSLWLAMHVPAIQIIHACANKSSANHVKDLYHFMIDSMDHDKRPGVRQSGRGEIVLDNNSKISFQLIDEHTMSGQSFDMLMLQDLAFVPHKISNKLHICFEQMKEAFKLKGKKIIAYSAPSTMEGMFYNIAMGPECEMTEKRKVWHHWTLPYRMHPHRNKDWAKKQRETLGERMFERSYECIFEDPDRAYMMRLSGLCAADKPKLDGESIAMPSVRKASLDTDAGAKDDAVEREAEAPQTLATGDDVVDLDANG